MILKRYKNYKLKKECGSKEIKVSQSTLLKYQDHSYAVQFWKKLYNIIVVLNNKFIVPFLVD